jgi:8-oxo-dGTP pyrophosphatase MutT (NUDIX family)
MDQKTTKLSDYAGVLLITPEGKLILQQRDDKPGIYNPGLITSFGGRTEEGESPVLAAIREMKEEVNLDAKESDLKLFGSYSKTVEKYGINQMCHYFIMKDVKPKNLIVNEGQGYVLISKEDNLDNFNLSPLAKKVAGDYFKMY